MGYPRTEPASEKEMLADPHPGHHTICQTLRDMYVKEEDEATKTQLRLVWAFAKKMHHKLKEYRKRYDDEMKNVNFTEEV